MKPETKIHTPNPAETNKKPTADDSYFFILTLVFLTIVTKIAMSSSASFLSGSKWVRAQNSAFNFSRSGDGRVQWMRVTRKVRRPIIEIEGSLCGVVRSVMENHQFLWLDR